jgi:hypothetical protein
MGTLMITTVSFEHGHVDGRGKNTHGTQNGSGTCLLILSLPNLIRFRHAAVGKVHMCRYKFKTELKINISSRLHGKKERKKVPP